MNRFKLEDGFADLFEALVKKADESIFPDKPSAGIAFFCKDDETVLLLLRSQSSSSPNTWDVIGGRPEDSDGSALETASRECYEEIQTFPKNKLPIAQHTIRTNKHWYIVYLIPLSKQEKKDLDKKINLSDEHQTYKWFDWNELPSDTHFPIDWLTGALNSL